MEHWGGGAAQLSHFSHCPLLVIAMACPAWDQLLHKACPASAARSKKVLIFVSATLPCLATCLHSQALQAELAARSEELLKFETLHRLLRGQLETRAGDAERRASRLAAANRELQQRRAHEMEGWAADVGALRKRIAAVDRKLTQQALLARLPDDERRDAVLARHARWRWVWAGVGQWS